MSEQNLIEIVTYSETRHWSEDGHQAQCNQTIWGDPVHEYVGRHSHWLNIPQENLLAEIEGMKQCSRCVKVKAFEGVDKRGLEPTGHMVPPVVAAVSPDGPRMLFWRVGREGNQKWVNEQGTQYVWANLIAPKRAKAKDLK